MAAISYLIWLTTREGMQPNVAVGLLRYFGTAEAVYHAGKAEYDLLSLPSRLCRSLLDKGMDGTERILEQCDRQGIHLIASQDSDYPQRLYQLEDHPLVLYVKGTLPRVDEGVAIGMVGSRKCSPYGEMMAGRIAMDLARSGAVVVSGMAEGIDAASLKGALQGGGRVISVLAGGVDVIYPACNKWLYQDIQAVGAVLSENPPGTRPEGWRFPIRNRIISGLSLGVLVVEAAEARSGSLITAHDALDQGRDVFAVPGPANAPMSGGTNLLISRGEAKLVRTAWDILSDYTGQYPGKLAFPPPMTAEEADARLSPKPGPAAEKAPEEPASRREEQPEQLPRMTRGEFDRLGEEQRDIFLLLEEHKLTADEIVGRTDIPARRVNTALTILQSQGYLKELPGRRFTAAVRFDQDR